MDIRNILAAAKEHVGEDGLSRQNFDNSWSPASGSYRVGVVKVNAGTTKTNKDPRIGVWLEILEGDDQGKRWWENITLFADNPAAAAVNIGKLIAMGVEEDTIYALNDAEAIAPLLEGWVGMAKVERKPNPRNPEDPYVNTYFSPEGEVGSASAAAVPPQDEDDSLVKQRGF